MKKKTSLKTMRKKKKKPVNTTLYGILNLASHLGTGKRLLLVPELSDFVLRGLQTILNTNHSGKTFSVYRRSNKPGKKRPAAVVVKRLI